MVKQELLKKISMKLAELCEKHGVSANLEVKNTFNAVCIVPIPRDLANERHEAVSEICDELRGIEEIKNIYDRGSTRIIRGDDYRQFEITVKDGFWTRTDADREEEQKAIRIYFDPVYAAEEKARREKARRQFWKEYIIPLPKPDNNPNTELYLTMAYEPYDWIDIGYDEDGEHLYKRTEFRAYTENYAKRLLSHPIKTVKFQRGYGGPGRGKPKQMRFEVKSITLWDPQSKMECDPHHLKEGIIPQFFAINLGERLS